MSQIISYTRSPHTSLSMHALPKLTPNNSHLKFLQKTRKPKLGEDTLTSKTRKPLLILQSDSSSSTSMDSWMSIYSTISISIGGYSLTSISDHGIYRNQLSGELYEQYFPGKPFQIYSDERRPEIQHVNNLKKNYITLTSKEVVKNEKELKVQNINDLRLPVTNSKPQHYIFDLKNKDREKDICSNHSVYLVVSDSSITDLSAKGLRSYKLHKVNKDLITNDQEVAVSIGKGLKLNYFRINNSNGSDHISSDGDEISDETEDDDNAPLNNSYDVTGEDIVFNYDSEQMSKDLRPNQTSNVSIVNNMDSLAQDENVIDIVAEPSVLNTMNTGQQGLTNQNDQNISNLLTNDKSTETQIYINNSFGAPVIYTEKHAQKGPFCIPYRVAQKFPECETNLPYQMKCVGGCNKTMSNRRGPMSRAEKLKQQEYNHRCTLNLDKMKNLMERLEQKMAVEVISVAVGNDHEFAKYDIDLQTDNVDLNLCCPNRRDICPCLLRRYAKILGTPSEQAIRRKKLKLGPCECTQNHPDSAPGIRLNKRPKLAFELEDLDA